ncbi:hypothetical protein EVAR_79521_1 [Eumeta japonica]|uniref:Uncharacterized protein n=1 Tax=Eumeta variegata TaxID=151549 RepID=A0A4C1UEQ8_EUMVA|nr:hypothetical protein EVAR_79521_1 [Eumeta japonica]
MPSLLRGTEYGREVAALTVAFSPVSESTGGLLSLFPFHQPDPPLLDIVFLPKRTATMNSLDCEGPYAAVTIYSLIAFLTACALIMPKNKIKRY